MSLTSKLLAPTVLVAVALAPAAFDPDARAGWSVVARTDSPFYAVGDTVEASFRIQNFTAESAYGQVPIVGGNGCVYSITIEDALGQTLWQPSSGCFFGTTLHNLASGETITGVAQVPLVYQNNGGIGVQGAPLPPGVYSVVLVFNFGGPQRQPGTFGPGLNHSVSIPIQVES